MINSAVNSLKKFLNTSFIKMSELESFEGRKILIDEYSKGYFDEMVESIQEVVEELIIEDFKRFGSESNIEDLLKLYKHSDVYVRDDILKRFEEGDIDRLKGFNIVKRDDYYIITLKTMVILDTPKFLRKIFSALERKNIFLFEYDFLS